MNFTFTSVSPLMRTKLSMLNVYGKTFPFWPVSFTVDVAESFVSNQDHVPSTFYETAMI